MTWRWTVCSLTTSRSAIWRLVSPREQAQHLALARRHGQWRRRAPAAHRSRRRVARASGRAPRPRKRPRRAAAPLGPPERGEARGELDPRAAASYGAAAALEAIDGILEQRPRRLVLATRRRRACPRQGRRCTKRRRADDAGESRADARRRGPPSQGRPGRAARAREQLERRHALQAQVAGSWRRSRSASSTARSAWPRSSARRARQSCAAAPGPAASSRRAVLGGRPGAAQLGERRRAGRRSSLVVSARSPRSTLRAPAPRRATGRARGGRRRTRRGRTRACTGSRSARRTRRSGRTTPRPLVVEHRRARAHEEAAGPGAPEIGIAASPSSAAAVASSSRRIPRRRSRRRRARRPRAPGRASRGRARRAPARRWRRRVASSRALGVPRAVGDVPLEERQPAVVGPVSSPSSRRCVRLPSQPLATATAPWKSSSSRCEPGRHPRGRGVAALAVEL